MRGERQAITTVAPLAARAFAVSRPRPLLAPVTRATRPDWSGMAAVVQGPVKGWEELATGLVATVEAMKNNHPYVM